MVYHFLLGKLQPPPTITTRPIYKWYSTAHVNEIPKFEFQPLLVRPIFSADEMVFLVDIWLVVSERKPKWNPGNASSQKCTISAKDIIHEIRITAESRSRQREKKITPAIRRVGARFLFPLQNVTDAS